MFESFDLVTALPFIVGIVIPLVVAAVTKNVASSKFKNVVLIGLSTLTAVLVPHIGDAAIDVPVLARTFFETFATATVTYLGLYKPQGTTAAIQTKIPGGLGKPAPGK